MRKFIPAIMALSLIMSSCELLFNDNNNNSNNNNEGDNDVQTDVNISSNITLDDQEQSFNLVSGKAQTIEIGFSAEGYWAAESSTSWINVTPNEGDAGHHILSIEVEENDSDDTRCGNVRLFSGGGGNPITIIIEQEEQSVFYVEEDIAYVDYDGGEIYAHVVTNMEYEVYISEEDSEWLYYIETRAVRGDNVILYADRNYSTEERSAVVELRSYDGDILQNFTVVQQGREVDYWFDCDDNISISARGDLLGIYVRTNIEYSIDIPEEASSWIKHTETINESTNGSGTRWETVKIEIEANDTGDTRSTTLSFVDNKGNVLKSTVINQNMLSIVTYTSTDGNIVTPYYGDISWTLETISNTYENGVGTILIDGKLTEINSNAFLRCSTLKSINIPNTVTTIGENAFKSCTSLKTITIPESVTSLGYGVFENCTALTDAILDCTLNELPNGLFRQCTSLQNFDIPNTITRIGNETFYCCSSYAIDTIDDNIVEIGESAFRGCTAINSIHLGSGIQTIGREAFSLCSNMEKVSIDNLSHWCQINFASLDANPLDCGKFLYVNGNILYNLTIPSDITEIKPYTFCNCLSISSATIGDHVTSIGDYAFFNTEILSASIGNSVTEIGTGAFLSCDKMESVTIGRSVEVIGDNAFESCSALTDIELPYNLKTIGKSAFKYCDLESVNIPTSLELIDEDAFSLCDIGELHIESITQWCKVELVNARSNPASRKDADIYVDGALTTHLDINSHITTVGNYAFYGWNTIKTIFIDDTVRTIGNYAFSYCGELESLNISDGVTTIGDYAFYGCNVDDVYLPRTVNYIGISAFESCINKSLTIAGAPETIADYAFKSCYFSTLNLEYGIKTIGVGAFYFCTKLESITIPSSVTELGSACFSSCRKLANVYCRPTTPPSVVGSSSPTLFNDCASDLTIYVPLGSRSDYQNAYIWRDYRDIIVGVD